MSTGPEWNRLECETDIQVLPFGEETYHSWDNHCECAPRVRLSKDGKLVVIHNAYDKRELFEVAYNTPLHKVRQEFDC
jgi:hypothetical protein